MKPQDIQIESLKLQIKLLKQKCIKCHRVGQTKAGLCIINCYPKHQQELALARVGNEYVDSKGYTRIYVLVGDEVKIAYKHRYLKSRELGRELRNYETVIFMDGDKGNLHPSNLVLGLKAGIVLEDITCPHCERKYGNGKAEANSTEATTEESNDSLSDW